MRLDESVKRSERAAALASVIALHALAFLLVLAARHGTVPMVAKIGSLSVVSLAAARPSPPPPPRPRPSEIKPKLRTQAAMSVPTQAASAMGAPGTPCGTLEVVMAALLEDPAAVSAVEHAPAETRSIADAIVIWNAEWSPAAGTIEAPLGAARASISRTLATVSDACLDEDVAGPRLLPISVGSGTTFLVVGSGMWRWRGLLTDPLIVPSANPNAAPIYGTG